VSTGTRRQDHDRADAYDAARSGINLELRKYSRRLKAAAEAFIDEEFQRHSAAGLLFDADTVAVQALEHARQMYVSREAIDAPAFEEGDVDAKDRRNTPMTPEGF